MGALEAAIALGSALEELGLERPPAVGADHLLGGFA